MDLSVETLMALEKPLDVTITQLRERVVDAASKKILNTYVDFQQQQQKNEEGSLLPLTDNNANIIGSNEHNCKYIREFLVRKNFSSEDFMEVRVAVVGNVDAGKSTLLGVLTHGMLDDGRGEARTKLFRHKHEIESGRTSSVGNDILGFDARGKIVNESELHSVKASDWEKICAKSAKVVTFIDLAGHEKYLKTTVFGMTGHAPDFCMLMVGSRFLTVFYFWRRELN
jgi:GTPase